MRRRVRRVRRVQGVQGVQGKGSASEIIGRILLYGLTFLILAAAQCSFFARLTLLPATPDLMLGAVVALTLLDSRRASVAAAVAGGFIVDALGGVGVSLSPVLYLTVALTVGAIAAKMMAGFPAWLMLMLPALLLRAGWTALLLAVGGVLSSAALTEVLLPEALCTLILCLPLYPLISLCTLPLRRRRERTRL